MSFFFLMLALAFSGSVQQETPPSKVPQKGDTIVVKGCLKGSSLESTETAILDSEATMMTDLVYRLTGDKDLLKQMRQKHEGEVIEVTGVLKSTLPPAGEIRGKTIGRTRITVGVGSSHVGSPANAEANRSIPVLSVKSYEREGFAVKCAG
jgi:hypothetical protein